MKKHIILITITVLFWDLTNAQQSPHYTQYSYNMNVVNPAYTATNRRTDVNLMARSQWAGVEGAPKTISFSFSFPAGENFGLGLSAINDEVGPVKEKNLYIDYSYIIKLSNRYYDRSLAFGLKAGATFLDVGLLSPNADNDPLNVPVSQVSPNIGVGVFYYTNSFYFGLSAPNLLNSRHLDKSDGVISTAFEEKHYFLTLGKVFDISRQVKFKPSTMLKAVNGSPLSIDISANLLYDSFFEVGLSYRLEDAFSGIIGLQINKNFRIGYAYDHSLSNFSNYNFGSHEVLLRFSFNNRKINSPRFF